MSNKTNKEKVIEFLKHLGKQPQSKNKRLFEMIEGGASVMAADAKTDDTVRDSDNPEKLKRAKEKLQTMLAARGLSREIVTNIASRISKTTPPGNSFETKIKHAVRVQKALDNVNIYNAFEDYCNSLGIKRPSSLGIYESVGSKAAKPSIEDSISILTTAASKTTDTNMQKALRSVIKKLKFAVSKL